MRSKLLTSAILSICVSGCEAQFNFSNLADVSATSAGPDLSSSPVALATPSSTPVPEISSWSFVDNGGSSGKNFDPARSAIAPRLVSFNNKLYGIWAEANASSVSQIRAAVYNGNDSSPGWSFIDGHGVNGINKDVTKAATTPVAIVAAGKLYLAWSESNGTVTQTRVAVYNGNDSAPSWNFVDGNGTNGVNKNVTLAAVTPQLGIANSKIYLHWLETNASGKTQIRVAVYNGNDSSPHWSFVDGDGAYGLNKDVTMLALSGNFATLNNRLYMTWQERNSGNVIQVRAAVYNGNDSSPAWNFIDGNGTNGLNYNPAKNAKTPYIATSEGRLFLIWREVNNSSITQVRAAIYNGNDLAPAWSFVDGNGANGLNANTAYLSNEPVLVSLNAKLYACWSEQNSSGIYQTRIRVFNGDVSSPSWTAVDGNLGNGINKNAANNAVNPSCAAYGTSLYAAWSEGATGQIMISVGK